MAWRKVEQHKQNEELLSSRLTLPPHHFRTCPSCAELISLLSVMATYFREEVREAWPQSTSSTLVIWCSVRLAGVIKITKLHAPPRL